MSDINKKIVSATKWSSIAELAAKLVSPISTMLLARLLDPSAFGIVVTATMVISFSEIFTDAGFQKYIVQHDFDSDDEKFKAINVAFLSNLFMSLFIWGIIFIFDSEIAALVGSPGHGLMISISSVCIPLAAFSSIQTSIFRRDFDFKTLFWVRLIGVLVPLFITVPIAYFTKSYWALIIGMIALNLVNAVLLTIRSQWKPNLFFNWLLLKGMLSFSIWSMIEAVSIWLTGYIDIFIVGKLLNHYYLGLYQTSMATVGQIVGLITAATTPVLFSSLSRLQSSPGEFEQLFLKFQKLVGILVIPIGVGIFVFQDFVTLLLLGKNWSEASFFIGLWGLTSSITIVFSHYCSEIYRAKGQPKLSVFVQLSHIICLVPLILWAVTINYDFLCEMRALVRLQLIIANLIVLYVVTKISFFTMLRNVYPSLLAATFMAFFIFLMPETEDSIIKTVLYIIIATFVYFCVIVSFGEERRIILNLHKYLRR